MATRMSKTGVAAIIIATMALIGLDVMAFGRDADGSRMQARAMSKGSSVSDRLSPPADVVDWRYVRLKEAGVLQVSLKSKPAKSSVRVNLTDAMGKSLGSASTKKGSASLRQKADPGLYYISVSANQATTYTLTVR